MGALIIWWVVVELLGLLAFPLTFRLFSARADHGYGFAKIIGLLLGSYVAWLLGAGGVPYGAALWAAIGLLVALDLALAWQGRADLLAWLRRSGVRTMLIQDALWTFGF